MTDKTNEEGVSDSETFGSPGSPPSTPSEDGLSSSEVQTEIGTINPKMNGVQYEGREKRGREKQR